MRTIGPAIVATIGPALLALALILGACTRAATLTPAPSATATRAPAASPTPIAKATATPTLAAAAATFFLEIDAPKDESVVTESSVLVLGRTVVDAVVSVNDEPVTVNVDGTFFTTITLEVGPNVIEVLASDFLDNQESKVFTVIYVR